MKKIIAVIILIVVLSVNLFLDKKSKQNKIANTPTLQTSEFDFLPTSTSGVVIKHQFYALSYKETYEQAEWVAYSLKKEDIVYVDRKRPYFIYDPKVQTQSASYKNYKNSGYDKGHLCPAADRQFSKNAYDETFYTSNITPQKNDFNAGVWNRLEQKTRYWAKKYKHIYVVTGGVLQKDLKTIGFEKVAVPNQFYKILLDYTEPEIKAIAFLVPHKESDQPLYKFVVSIDEIEKLTGIDFFPNLPDEIEEKLESSSNYKNWSFR